MSDIVAFLKARLDEDEDRVNRQQAMLDEFERLRDPASVNTVVVMPFDELGGQGDVTRALAEVDAKRRIIDEHGWKYADPYEEWKDDTYRAKWGDSRNERLCTRCTAVAWPCPTLRLLVLPFADRADYDPDWRPEEAGGQ